MPRRWTPSLEMPMNQTTFPSNLTPLRYSPYRSLLEISSGGNPLPLDGAVFDFVFRMEKEFPDELATMARVYPQHVHAVSLLRTHGTDALQKKAKEMGDFDD
jgi:hypothetical protein